VTSSIPPRPQGFQFFAHVYCSNCGAQGDAVVTPSDQVNMLVALPRSWRLRDDSGLLCEQCRGEDTKPDLPSLIKALNN